MQFVDEIKIKICAGDGGSGAIAFHREKHRPKGGPAGGDGGRGGDVVFVADENVGTLMDLRYRHQLVAKSGENGQGSDCYGKCADHLIVRVPVGTAIFDDDTGELLHDLVAHREEYVGAAGGHGGLGNIHFTTSSNQAPHRYTGGKPGESRNVRLELRLLADVGLVGLPSVGKSSIIASISAARPRIADYPFTTLVPNLGVVQMNDTDSYVVADIPGIIKGASNGAGLGLRFLKHIQRTALLVYVIALDATMENDLLSDFEILRHELRTFDETLLKRAQIAVLNKSDLSETRDLEAELRQWFEDQGIALIMISAATRDNVDELKNLLADKLAHRDENV